MVKRKQQISKFARLSIEALYLAGAFVGANGLLLLVIGRTTENIIFGVCLLSGAFILEWVSHKALTSSSEWYYVLGAISLGGFGISILMNVIYTLVINRGIEIPALLVIGLILGVFLITLASYTYIGSIFSRAIWQIVSIIGCFAAFVVYVNKIWTNLYFWVISISSVWLLFSVVLAVRYRWIALQKVVPRPKPKKPFRKAFPRHKPKKLLPKMNTQNLWKRGRFYEIFGLSEDATKIELTKGYAEKMNQYKGHKMEENILREAYSILLVNETTELYKKARAIMRNIKKKVGVKRFEKREPKIWEKLWSEVYKEFRLRPELLSKDRHRRLVKKYMKG